MNINLKTYLEGFKNTGTIIAVASIVLGLLANFGLNINNDLVMNIINGICGLGVALGVLNNPTTPGVDTPTITTKDK